MDYISSHKIKNQGILLQEVFYFVIRGDHLLNDFGFLDIIANCICINIFEILFHTLSTYRTDAELF